MNLFTQNSPYYHRLKYLIFLLKHPVYKEISYTDMCVFHLLNHAMLLWQEKLSSNKFV